MVAFLAAVATCQGKLSGVVFAESGAFRFHRICFTYDNDIDSAFVVRFQLEADEIELTSRGKIAVFVRQAFLRWKHLGPAGDLIMGMSPTPLCGNAEALWA